LPHRHAHRWGVNDAAGRNEDQLLLAHLALRKPMNSRSSASSRALSRRDDGRGSSRVGLPALHESTAMRNAASPNPKEGEYPSRLRGSILRGSIGTEPDIAIVRPGTVCEEGRLDPPALRLAACATTLIVANAERGRFFCLTSRSQQGAGHPMMHRDQYAR